MPAGYHINDNDGLVAIEVTGAVNLADIYGTAKRLLADPSYDPNLPQLIDLRGMEIELQAATVAPFTRFMVARYAPQTLACIAVVIDPELEADICARVYWISCALGSSEVFDNYELALKWLMKQEFAKAASS
jgi:hypothetical protein